LLSAHRFPDGDRENAVTVTEVSQAGVTYAWSFIQRDESGNSFAKSFKRFVRSTDLASAPRLNTVFLERQTDAPGYTAFTFSRATYAQLRSRGEAPYTVVSVEGGPFVEASGRSLLPSRVTFKGRLTLVSPTPALMPMLVNARRVSLPVLHVKGRFGFQEQKEESDYSVLADSLHPLILRIVSGVDTVQTVRIVVPEAPSNAERELETVCRVELPGLYFAFASAELQPASAPALAGVADLLARHPEWSFSIEGHTDSVGDPASNLALSKRRAESVKAKLVELHRVDFKRLHAEGYGAFRPREPNATIEGRARNRRVELVRDCNLGRDR
jgi:outer membrane protein OmpA-like peptidoglycan-associated protein